MRRNISLIKKEEKTGRQNDLRNRGLVFKEKQNEQKAVLVDTSLSLQAAAGVFVLCSGSNLALIFLFLQSIVQVETLGEFGVFFTLFLVGLEFSPEKLRKVRI